MEIMTLLFNSPSKENEVTYTKFDGETLQESLASVSACLSKTRKIQAIQICLLICLLQMET